MATKKAKVQKKEEAPKKAPEVKSAPEEKTPMVIKGEHCPFCNKKTLALLESEMDIPYFGKTYIFAMDCANPECGYHKADVESAEENKEPSRYTLRVDFHGRKTTRERILRSKGP